MKKIVLIIILPLFILGASFVVDKNGSTDDNVQTISIGSQTWMTTNLNVSQFRNGDSIPQAETPEEWISAGENMQPCWCYYENNEANGERYGKLYNWYAVVDPRGLAPNGWHIPSNSEWSDLINTIEPQTTLDSIYNFGINAAPKLKSANGWDWGGNGNNESGFNGLPGGYRLSDGRFFGINLESYWWSTDEDNSYNGACRYLGYDSNNLIHSGNNKEDGLFVRCLKD